MPVPPRPAPAGGAALNSSGGSSSDSFSRGTPTISEDGPAVPPEAAARRVRPESFDVQNVIGKGGFGKVLLVTRQSEGGGGAAAGAALFKSSSGYRTHPISQSVSLFWSAGPAPPQSF